jgi:hypothetical protein
MMTRNNKISELVNKLETTFDHDDSLYLQRNQLA